jgi:hypothetical protein
MIIHLDVWLDELRRLDAEFEKGCEHNNGFAIERALYYSALLIRKLSETPFVKRGFLSPVIEGPVFKLRRSALGRLNPPDARSPFDSGNSLQDGTSLAGLCDILIHSLLLEWRPAVGRVEQIFVGVETREGGAEARGFTPSQYVGLLRYVEDYRFKRVPLTPARRAG